MSVPTGDFHLTLPTGIAILVSSLSGSVHCAAMCGGLMLSASAERFSLQLVYHLTRGAAYVAAGALAGYGAEKLWLQLWLEPLRLLFTAILALVLIILGVLAVSDRPVSVPFSGGKRIAEWGIRRSFRQTGVVRAGMIGAFSVFLPCGWLWTYLLLAVSVHSVPAGAAVMALFWVGTVPSLAFTRELARFLISRFAVRAIPRAAMKRAIGVLMILAGLVSVAEHARHFHSDRASPTVNCGGSS